MRATLYSFNSSVTESKLSLITQMIAEGVIEHLHNAEVKETQSLSLV